MGHRRRGERVAIWLLVLSLGHVCMALVSAQGNSGGGGSQEYINGMVTAKLADLENQVAVVRRYQDYILLAIAGGFIAQIYQLMAGARARGGDSDDRRRRG